MTAPTPPAAPLCSPTDLFCLGKMAVSSVVTDALTGLATSVVTAVGNVIKTMTTLWVGVGGPGLGTGSASGQTVTWLRAELAWFTGMLAVLSMIIGGAKLAWDRRKTDADDLGHALFTLVIVNSMSVAIIGAATVGADAFARWLIDQSTQGTSFGANMTEMLAVASLSGLGLIVVILLGLFALFASLIQIVLMIARSALIVVLTGVMPLASAATNTALGRAWHQRILGWTIAVILYQPAAAIIYATAFRLAGSNQRQTGLIPVLTGILLMIMALFALPALMRLAVPMVAAVNVGGGRGAGGGAVIGGLIATGGNVVAIRQQQGPTGAAGMAGASGPVGAAGAAVAAGVQGVRRGARRAANPGADDT